MNQALGRHLKRVRKQRNLTLRAVEEKTGISNAYLSQVENSKINRPSPSVLLKLADCYSVSYVHLMELTGHPIPNLNSNNEKVKPSFRLSSGSFLDDLTDEEKKRVLEYIEFLRSRKRSRK